jgi:hypothetical protein
MVSNLGHLREGSQAQSIRVALYAVVRATRRIQIDHSLGAQHIQFHQIH